jgi:hypothetical protein
MKYFTKNIFCAGMILLAGCGKEKAADPTVEPAKSLSLDLNGKSFAVDLAASTLVVDPVKRTILLTAKGTDGITEISFQGYSNDSNPRGIYAVRKFVPVSLGGVSGETSGLYRSVFNNVLNCYGRTLSGIETYSPFNCNHADNLVLDIQTVNEAKRTMSGRFSGTFCKNAEPCDDKAITNGQFNLAY